MIAETWASAFRPVDAVVDLVAGARRASTPPGVVALFTNNDALLRDLLPVMLPRVAAQFDELVFSCDLGWMKPDRRAFETALDVLGARPEEAVFVDDSERNVRCALELGIDGIRFVDPDRLSTEFAARGLLPAPPT